MTCCWPVAGGRRLSLSLPFRARKEHHERRAAFRRAVHVDPASAALHHITDDPESETGAATIRLRGEERLEDLRLRLVVHPGARIVHREGHVVTGGKEHRTHRIA